MKLNKKFVLFVFVIVGVFGSWLLPLSLSDKGLIMFLVVFSFIGYGCITWTPEALPVVKRATANLFNLTEKNVKVIGWIYLALSLFALINLIIK